MARAALSDRQIAAITHQRRRARVMKDLEIEQRRMTLAVDGDVEAVADAGAALVPAYLGRDTRVYCGACVEASDFQPPVPWSSEPDVPCASCGRPVREGRAS